MAANEKAMCFAHIPVVLGRDMLDLKGRYVMRQIAITDFDFTTFPADQDNLIKAWLPEIEESVRSYVPDDRFIAFLIAALRIGARSRARGHSS